jgi:pyruvate dehydrogenase E1 component alpha subunit
MGAHTTSDDPSRYRDPAELAVWEARDPLLRLRRFLEREDLADRTFLGEVDAAAETLAAQVRAGCRAIADPSPGAMFANVYATEPSALAEQRRWHEQYLASFEDAPLTGAP